MSTEGNKKPKYTSIRSSYQDRPHSKNEDRFKGMCAFKETHKSYCEKNKCYCQNNSPLYYKPKYSPKCCPSYQGKKKKKK